MYMSVLWCPRSFRHFADHEILANPPVTKIEIPTKWKLGESWADASAFLVLFVLLLGLARRRR